MDQTLHILHFSNRPECKATLDKHFDGYYTLQLVTRGFVILGCDGESWKLGPGYFWFHYPGPRFTLAPADGPTWHHRHIAIRGPRAEAWFGNGLLSGSPVNSPLESRPQLTSRFDEILAWAAQSGIAPQAKAAAALELLLWELWEIRRAPEDHHAVLEALAEYAQARRFRAGNYENLAQRLGLSGSTLRRRVREATGLPLHQYTRRLRLNEARRLLRTSDRSLPEIAEALGFTDEFYFNREFSRLAGMPPGAYRNSLM